MKILVTLTGGTFSSIKTENGLSASENTDKKLLENLENEVKLKLPFDVELIFTEHISIASENADPSDWGKIADFILSDMINYKDISGILVVHGTDTMAYTASAISYLENITKKYPIVFTGASYPLSISKHNATTNFLQSIYALKNFIDKKMNGCFLVFNAGDNINDKEALIHLSTKCKKDNWEIDGYRSFYIGKKSIGTISNVNKFNIDEDLYKNFFNKTILFNNIKPLYDSKKVVAYKIHPGFYPEIIKFSIDFGVKAILLEIYNSGTAPMDGREYSLNKVLEYAKEKGVLVFLISQHEGKKGISMDIYETSNILKKFDVISLKDMIWEAALSKLKLAYGNFEKDKDIKKFMLTNIAGEISD